jgi:hypothetical protein
LEKCKVREVKRILKVTSLIFPSLAKQLLVQQLTHRRTAKRKNASSGDRSKATQKTVAAFVLFLCLFTMTLLLGGEQPGVLVNILLRHGKRYLESGYRSACERDWKFSDRLSLSRLLVEHGWPEQHSCPCLRALVAVAEAKPNGSNGSRRVTFPKDFNRRMGDILPKGTAAFGLLKLGLTYSFDLCVTMERCDAKSIH